MTSRAKSTTQKDNHKKEADAIFDDTTIYHRDTITVPTDLAETASPNTHTNTAFADPVSNREDALSAFSTSFPI